MKSDFSSLRRLASRLRVWLWLGAFIAGFLLSRSSILPAGSSLYIIPPLAAALVWAAWKRKTAVFVLLALALAMLAGSARHDALERRYQRGLELYERHGAGPVRMVFRVDDLPESHGDYSVLWGVAERTLENKLWNPCGARLRLSVGDDIRSVHRGDRLLALASLKKPTSFNNPGGFDYAAYLERRSVAVQGWADSRLDLVPLKDQEGISILGLVDTVRERYVSWILSFGGEGAELAAALLAGEREALDPAVTESFERTGLSHILVISGLHLGLAAAGFYVFFLWAFRRINRITERMAAQRLAAALTIPSAVAYAAMTGMRVPTQRALVMVIAFMAALAFDRERDTWNALGIAACAVLIAWPEAMFEASFQLSFIAVAGILYGWPRVVLVARGHKTPAEEELDRLEAAFGAGGLGAASRAWRYLGGLLAVNVIIVWSIFPLQAGFFHSANPAAPLYNLFVVPFTGVVLLPAGLAASVSEIFSSTLGSALMQVETILCNTLVLFVRQLSERLDTFMLVPHLSWWSAIGWYLFGLLGLEGTAALRTGKWSWQVASPDEYRWKEFELGPRPDARARKLYALSALGLSACLFSSALLDMARDRSPFPEGAMVVSAIEVGQGQSIYVRTADGKNLLVDGGGFYKSNYDVGKGVVAPLLLRLGVTRLDAVVLSHPHPDHAKGLAYVLANFEVGEFWRSPYGNELSEELDSIARSRGIQIRELDESSPPFRLGECRVRVLHPPASAAGGLEGFNDLSLVLRLESGGVSALLAGDVEAAAEHMLVSKYGYEGVVEAGLLKADVLSVPHHGSRTSSTLEFLESVNPGFALVSASGRPGLPSDEVMERYHDLGIPVQRTDLDGWSAVVSDKGRIRAFDGKDL